jgi:hypothetical protein
MSTAVFDLQELYARNFGSKPVVGALSPIASNEPRFQLPKALDEVVTDKNGSILQTLVNGKEIWLPTKFRGLNNKDFNNGEMDLPYTVISIKASASWVKTPLADRQGSAKELYTIDDYQVTLKGFLIDLEKRIWPYDDLVGLNKIHQSGEPFELDNALSNICLKNKDNAECKVVMTSFELLPVEGGRKHVRPFVMQLESDNIFTLELA